MSSSMSQSPCTASRSSTNEDPSIVTSTSTPTRPIAADLIPPQSHLTTYPPALASHVQGRIKRRLGDYFQLSNFGVNHTTLTPGAASSLQHYHATQDEFIYILQGSPTLRWGDEKIILQAGDCMGFPKHQGIGHCLINETDQVVVYLEVGDRSPQDVVQYTDVDLMARMMPEEGESDKKPSGKHVFLHKDGTPY
jgi:uncharacterized cupin superfamily protein